MSVNSGKSDRVSYIKLYQKNGLNAVLKPFCLAGAEGLEPSARGFGTAQKWYYLVSPNAVKPKKNSNYQQSQDFVTLSNI